MNAIAELTLTSGLPSAVLTLTNSAGAPLLLVAITRRGAFTAGPTDSGGIVVEATLSGFVPNTLPGARAEQHPEVPGRS